MVIVVTLAAACSGDVASSGGGGDGSNVPVGGDGGAAVMPPGGTAMQLSILSPKRGATLNGDKTISVEGQVTGANVTSLTVNGAAITPAADGTFTHSVQATHGMNLLIVEASDNEGNREKLVQSFYHSASWRKTDPAAPTTALIDSAAVGWLGQPVFDDGNAATPDFASVVEGILTGLDVTSMIPSKQRIDNVAGCDHADIKIKNVAYNPPKVSLDVNPGELLVKVVVTGLQAKVKANLDGDWYNPACLVGVSGKVKAKSVEVTARFGVVVEGDQLRAQAKQTSAKVSGFDIDISGIWGFLTNWLVDTFEKDLAKDLEKQIKGALDKQIGPLLSKGVADLAIDEQIKSSPLIGEGPKAVVDVVSRLGVFELQPDGIRYGMKATAVAEPVAGHTSLGSIGHCASSPALAFQDKGKNAFQIALREDLLNQLLYSLHQGGLLKANVTQKDFAEELGKVGVTDFEGTIDALLPPIYNSCVEGDPLLQLGDVGLQMKFKLLGSPVEMQVHISLEAPVGLEVLEDAAGQRLHLAIKKVSRLEMESKNLASGESTIFDTVKVLAEKQVVPQLLALLESQSVSFPIPEIDLHQVDKSIPAGTTIKPHVTRVEQRGGYLVVVGDIN